VGQKDVNHAFGLTLTLNWSAVKRVFTTGISTENSIARAHNFFLRSHRVASHLGGDGNVGIEESVSVWTFQRIDGVHISKVGGVEAWRSTRTVLKAGSAAEVVAGLLRMKRGLE
jgi:hypothetical protein